MRVDRRFRSARGCWTRALCLTIGLVVLISPTSSPVVSAAQPGTAPALAQDGRDLSIESDATRASFTAVWGDRANAEWIQEHDALLSGGKPATGPRIGYLSSATPDSNPPTTLGFVAGLRDAGYSPGQNITIEWRFANSNNQQLPGLAAGLAQQPVDVIVTPATPESLAAQQTTSTIPIVTITVGDPVGVGLVASLEQPGGNITGTILQPLDFNAQRLALLKEAVPNARRIAVLANVANAANDGALAVTQAAATRLGLNMQTLGVRSADDLPGAFAAATQQNADAILMIADTLFTASRPQILQLAAQTGIPVQYPNRLFVDDGGLMDYAILSGSQAPLAAGFVANILHGANPADLAMGVPNQFEMVLNLKGAQAIGYEFPQSALDNATEIIR